MKIRLISFFVIMGFLIPVFGSIIAFQAHYLVFQSKQSKCNQYGKETNPESALTIPGSANGTPICTAPSSQYSPQIVSDGMGGAIVTWQTNPATTIFAQRINSAGAVQWPADGIVTCFASSYRYGPQIASDGASGAIITWMDFRNGNLDIYAQRVSAAGTLLWGANGTAICNASGIQSNPSICADGTGGAVITWEDQRGATYDIYAQRVNSAGATLWNANGTLVCNASSDQNAPVIAASGVGCAVIAWIDNRGIDLDIYAQLLDAAGVCQWNNNGTVICNATGSQLSQQIIGDGAGGAIITWEDQRVASHIYAQRVSAAGIVKWSLNGTGVCTMDGDQFSPQITSDNSGGAIIAWSDLRDINYDIYAQRLNAAGTPQWINNGTVICNAEGDQLSPCLIGDNYGGAIIGWEDQRGSDPDIYAQRISSTGVVRWTVNGIAICTEKNAQQSVQITGDTLNDAVTTWLDFRDGNGDIYAQVIRNDPPTVNTPQNAIARLGGASSISWTLTDDQCGGSYRVIVTNIDNGASYVWVNWTTWTSGVPLNVPINSGDRGTFNYTIQYSDDENTYGIEDVVSVSVKNLAVSGPSNVNMTAGSSSNSLQWVISDEFSPTPAYTILRNGTVMQQGFWSSSQTLPFALDSLTAGTYNFTLIASETGGVVAQSSTIVTVLPAPAASTPLSFSETILLVFVGLTAFGLIIAVALLIRTQRRLTNVSKEIQNAFEKMPQREETE